MHVLVTGATGHLGSQLVTALVAAGHRVRAGVRGDPNDAKTARLRASGVELAQADVMRPEQLRAAMDGIDVVCHAAAVYSYVEPEREREILDVSIRGVESALRAAADAGVRKVVLTSSVVTLPLTAPDAPPSTEDDWTTALDVPYIRAKTEAERLAWRLAPPLGIDLVTVLPGACGGPGFAHNTPTIDLIEAMMLNGFRMGCPDSNLPYVDVRDVASAHVLAAERDVHGRFIVADDEMPTFRRLLDVMHGIDPRVRPPLMRLPDAVAPLLPLFDRLNARVLGTPAIVNSGLVATLRGRRWNASNRRAKDVLGWQPLVPLERSLRDTMAELRRRRDARAGVQGLAPSSS